MAKTKTLQYNCVECNKEVFRVGNGVREDLKLCGLCSRAKKVIKKYVQNTSVKPPSRPVETLTVEDVFKPANPELNITPIKSNPLFNEEIAGKIRTYQLLLSRVIDLLLELKEGHEETFLTLWLKAKEELRVE